MHPKSPPVHELTLGERRFVALLQELTTAHVALVPGARVTWKRNASGDLVLAVIVPAVRM
jgi:hypothetical protein